MDTHDTNVPSSLSRDFISVITKNDIEARYVCSFLLHALGDTIGFKNGNWEFNYYKPSSLTTVSEFVYEFIDLGGVNGINLEGWHVSDDTMYGMATGKAMLTFEKREGEGEGEGVTEKFILFLKDQLTMYMGLMMMEEEQQKIKRYPGTNINKYIDKFTDVVDGRNLPYDPRSGGNGAAMRALPVGMALWREEELDLLIKCSVETSKVTHNSPIGYLAGFTASYFASLAVRKVELSEWPILLLGILDSEKIRKYVDLDNIDVMGDYVTYVRYWKKYVDTRFKDGKPMKLKVHTNLIFRTKYYYDNFVLGDDRATFIGISGHCGMIMVYDTLLDCGDKWEKLIFYGILHPGDSDTIGAIAGGLYGLLYGIGDVPLRMLSHLEERDNLFSLGRRIWGKFYGPFGTN